MFRLSTSLCPFCEARSLAQAVVSPWQQTQFRGAATLQKRKPSRMTLSPNVRRGPPAHVQSESRPTRRKERQSPFGGMNVSVAPRDVQHAKEREAGRTAQRRADRRTATKGKQSEKSRDPMKALKMQRALSNVPYEKRSRVKEALQQHESFASFDLIPVLKENIASQALGGMVDVSPTPIQRLAIPALLGMEDGKRKKKKELEKTMQQFLLAAETGSGKTLAYILPIIDAIKRTEYVEAAQKAREAEEEEFKQQEKARNRMFELEAPSTNESDPDTARPRAIILLPTSELVDQVGKVVKSLGHKVKYRSALISAAYTGTVIRSRLFGPGGIDIVVCTPHLLNSITEADPNILSRVTHLVIDEADSLFDRSFSPITSSIIDRATPSLQQLVLCSATIPRNLDSYLHKRYPDIRRLATPNLHAIPRRVQLSVVDTEKIPFQGNRDLACAQTIYDISREGGGDESSGHNQEASGREKKIVVFVNEREKADEVATYLRTKGIDAVSFNRDSDERKQAEILEAFTGITGDAAAAPKQTHQKENHQSDRNTDNPAARGRPQLPNTKVLVMTDLGSRGIDTLPVRNVVLYDVPHTSIDFIHRLGRVGRMGRRGRGVVLAGRHDRKDIIKEVREGMFRGQALI